MPAYNEEKRIGNTLERYSEFFDELGRKQEFEYKILVVINNTNDRTEEIVKMFSDKNKNILYLNFEQGGKGFAIIEGFKEFIKANYNLIGFADADMATSPKAFYDLVRHIDGYDGVIASRYVRGAVVKPKPTVKRIVASRAFNFVLRTLFLFNYKDTQCGAKIFKKQVLSQVIDKMTITHWAFDVDLLYNLKKSRFKVKEHPTVWSSQDYSKINLAKDSSRMLSSVIQLRIKNSIFRQFLKPFKRLSGHLWRKIR